jgi:hypothetical protein
MQSDWCGHALCTDASVQRLNRRKSSSAILVDRRKSYLDVMERVLGDAYLPDTPPPAVRVTGVLSQDLASHALSGPGVIVVEKRRGN